jgi:FHS family L-fucose permease-like MFS transporter
MAYQAQETHVGADDKPFIKQYRLFHAAFAQFCYTGAQVAIASFFINYATATRPNTDDSAGAQLFAGAQAAFTVGRFLGVVLMKFIKPRLVFLAFISCCIIFMIPAIALPDTVGYGKYKVIPTSSAPVAMGFMVLFFESICFPTIVGLGMRGLGRHTKRGSGYIIAGVAGGAVVPPLTGVANDHHGNAIGFVVPLIFLAAAWTYAFAVNFIPAYVKVVDSFGETEVGLKGRDVDPEAVMADRKKSVEQQEAVADAHALGVTPANPKA